MRRLVSFLCYSVSASLLIYGLADTFTPAWQLPPLFEVTFGVAGGALVGKVIVYGWHIFH